MQNSFLAVFVLFVLAAIPCHAQPDGTPPTVHNANGQGPSGQWTLRSRHIVWGLPKQTDARHNVLYPGEAQARAGLSVLVREGFVVGHYDLHKIPAWVSVRWSREDFERLQSTRFGRPFAPDEELPRYAQAGKNYDFSTSNMERGHMARHEDNEAWGEDNSDAGCLMSNCVPQHKDMNGEAWNDLEEMHQQVVSNASVGIDTVWVISGPMFDNGQPRSTVGNGVAVPEATFKVIGWFDSSGTFHARGYVVRQEDRVRNNPAHYLSKIRDIEAATGLDFFPDLPASRANAIESTKPTDLWGSSGPAAGAVDGTGPAASASVRIHSLMPNPPGDESQHESVTLRNTGTTQVRVDGWRLRDRSGKAWNLFGTIDPGDERTFLRSGQPMALNNSGPETVELLRTDGSVADRVEYDGAGEGSVLLADSLR